jgi:hypothetical protein
VGQPVVVKAVDETSSLSMNASPVTLSLLLPAFKVKISFVKRLHTTPPPPPPPPALVAELRAQPSGTTTRSLCHRRDGDDGDAISTNTTRLPGGNSSGAAGLPRCYVTRATVHHQVSCCVDVSDGKQQEQAPAAAVAARSPCRDDPTGAPSNETETYFVRNKQVCADRSIYVFQISTNVTSSLLPSQSVSTTTARSNNSSDNNMRLSLDHRDAFEGVEPSCDYGSTAEWWHF